MNTFLETDIVPKTPMKERAQRIFDESLDESVPAINLNDASAMEPEQSEKPSSESVKEFRTMESVEEEAEEEVTPEADSTAEPFSIEEINQSRAEYEKRYSSLKVVELKKICDSEKLPKLGRKAELVNRIVDNSKSSLFSTNLYTLSFRTEI